MLLCGVMTTQAQAPYFDAGFDVNKAVRSNDVQGFDFDVEVGSVSEQVGAYLTYGRFDAQDYQNIGVGVDFYPVQNKTIDFSFGLASTLILRKYYHTGVLSNNSYHQGYLGWAARINGVFWATNNIGLSTQVQFQNRPDLSVYGIPEFKLGIRFRT